MMWLMFAGGIGTGMAITFAVCFIAVQVLASQYRRAERAREEQK